MSYWKRPAEFYQRNQWTYPGTELYSEPTTHLSSPKQIIYKLDYLHPLSTLWLSKRKTSSLVPFGEIQFSRGQKKAFFIF